MTDVARIDRIIEKLRTYWRANPELRLGQIVCNCTPRRMSSARVDPFYADDEGIERLLDIAIHGLPERKPYCVETRLWTFKYWTFAEAQAQLYRLIDEGTTARLYNADKADYDSDGLTDEEREQL